MINRANFAAPNTGTGSRYKTFKLVKEGEGSNRYRIGPAYASLAPSGQWNKGIRQHFGYRTGVTEQNPNGFARTFICIEERDRKTDMVKVACPECDHNASLKERLELRKEKLIKEGKSEKEIDDQLGPQKKYVKEHNLDKKHIVLAKNEQGEWGVLWMAWKALEALINRRKKILAEEGIDILGINDGAWVEFTRTGDKLTTTYACDVVYQTVATEGGKKAKVIKQEALTDADFDAIEQSCPDLSTVGTRLTASQIERLVESKGDTEIAENIFNEARGRSSKESSATPQVKVEPKPEQPKQQKEISVEDSLQEKIRKLQEELDNTKRVTKPPPVKDEETSPDDLPDDQFIQIYGNKK